MSGMTRTELKRTLEITQGATFEQVSKSHLGLRRYEMTCLVCLG